MSSTSSSLLLVLHLCLAVYACTARPIGNNENEPGKSFQFSSIKNKEKLNPAGVYIMSNPAPKWEPAKIGSSLLKNDKNEEKSSRAGAYILSNPKPKWEPPKIGNSLLKNDKNEEKSSRAGIYIVLNPKPRSESAKIGTSLLKNEKNEEKSIPAGVYIVSNPKPGWEPAKIGSFLLKNDKVKGDIRSTFAKDHLDDEKHEKKVDQTSEVEEADDDDTTEFPVPHSSSNEYLGQERPWYHVDYASAREQPPHHN